MRPLDANDILREDGAESLRRAIDEHPCPEAWSLIENHRVVAPRMLIRGLLPYKGIAFVGGQSGAGKTFVSVDLAVSLSTKAPFFSREVRERVGVAYLAAEGSEQLGNRLFAAARARGVELSNIPIAWRGDAPIIANAADVDAIADELVDLGRFIRSRYGVRLGATILDTVAATFALEDEDDNAEIAKAIRNMRWLGNKTGSLIVPVHHYGKTATTGLRGGSAWRAGADVVLSVTADRREITGQIDGRELAVAKARDGFEGPIAPFTLAFSELGHDQNGDTFGTCVVHPRLGEPPLSGAKKQQEPVAVRKFRCAFTEAVNSAGRIIRVRGDGPIVRAVDLREVRTQFESVYATGESDAGKRADAQRKAFKRAMSKLSNQLQTWVDGNIEWIWSTTSAPPDNPDRTDTPL
jgi:AAA domain